MGTRLLTVKEIDALRLECDAIMVALDALIREAYAADPEDPDQVDQITQQRADLHARVRELEAKVLGK